MHNTKKTTSALLCGLLLAAPTAYAEAAPPMPIKERSGDKIVIDQGDQRAEQEGLTALTIVAGIESVGDAYTICHMTNVPRPNALENVCSGYQLATLKVAGSIAAAIVQRNGGKVCEHLDVMNVRADLEASYADPKNAKENYLNLTVDRLVNLMDCSPTKKPGKKKSTSVKDGQPT